MTAITGILFATMTGWADGAGTDGDVYLGIAGREFHIDSSKDDNEAGDYREYVLGDVAPGTKVLNPEFNDPRKGWPLDTDTLGSTPKYVRFKPTANSDNWLLFFAVAIVYTGKQTFEVAFMTPELDLWLGYRSGLVVHLTEEVRDRQQVLATMREAQSK